jgi:class 3 adenylate cyclase
VLVSQSTRDALGDRATVKPMKGLELKGVAKPVTGYVVEALAPYPDPEEPT